MGQSQMKQTKGSFYSCGLLLIGAKELLNYHPDVQGKQTNKKKPSKQAEFYNHFPHIHI